MFSREESKKLRHEFWTSFGISFPTKWILYQTNIKGLALKFSFDTREGIVSMDVDIRDSDRKENVWNSLVALQTILMSEYLPDAIYDPAYILENGKEIARIYVSLEQVSIHDKSTWQRTMVFFRENMVLMESFFSTYKEILEE